MWAPSRLSSGISLAERSAGRSRRTKHFSSPITKASGRARESQPLRPCRRRQHRRHILVESRRAHRSNCTPTTVTVDPAAQSYFTFYHLPTGRCGRKRRGLGIFTFAGQQIVNENFFTTRVDHKFSQNDSLFGTYMYDKTPYSSPDGLNNVEFKTLTARQFVAIEETHIFTPRFANSIRIGGNHEAVNNNQSLKAINPDAARTDLGVGGTRVCGAGRSPGSDRRRGHDFTGGVGGSPTYFYHWNSLQAYDDAFFTKGTHSIRFGAAFERMTAQRDC